MRVENTPMHCIECKREWIGEIIVWAPVEVAVAAIKAMRCPACGADTKSVVFGRGEIPDPIPSSDGLTDSQRRAAWLKLHDSGLSSMCIADKMCGMMTAGNYPHDGDDFGRCERLLILYPTWRARLSEMTSVNGYWAALVGRWSEIAESWRHDTELWRTKGRRAMDDEWMCYSLMRSILNPVSKEFRSGGIVF